MAQNEVIVVTGPTASGKSALALDVAAKRNGVVINADAMQTYDAFPILTAQPSAGERARVPHALYCVLPLEDTLNAGRWRRLATAEIERAHAAGQVPILCGGSGLYLKALMTGFASIPDVPVEIRERSNAEWAEMGGDAFRARLAERDPAIVEKLKTGDRQRHVRAWEVLQATGTALSVWQQAEDPGAPLPWRFTTVLLSPDRAWLRARIATRFDAMLAEGVIAEARAVFDRQPDPRCPGLKAHGAPELFAYFRGEQSIDDVRRIAIDHTRQYAKRQMTWFRGQMKPDLVVDPASRQGIEPAAQFLTKMEV